MLCAPPHSLIFITQRKISPARKFEYTLSVFGTNNFVKTLLSSLLVTPKYSVAKEQERPKNNNNKNNKRRELFIIRYLLRSRNSAQFGHRQRH